MVDKVLAALVPKSTQTLSISLGVNVHGLIELTISICNANVVHITVVTN